MVATDREAILDYCAEDVDALLALLPVMEPAIATSPLRFGQALLRGRYMAAAAAMERSGIPIDVDLLARLRTHWQSLKRLLIEQVDGAYGVYEDGNFRTALFEAWWSDAATTGRACHPAPLALDTRRFAPWREFTRSWSRSAAPNTLGRAAAARSRGRPRRSQPRAYSPPSRPRRAATPQLLQIRLRPGDLGAVPDQAAARHGLAYIDWKAQEIGIAAALSGDAKLAAAVLSGDPYLAFAIRAQLAPEGATKATHGAVRDRIKACVLGIGYGMSDATLARRLSVSVTEARMLLRLHDEAYPAFARWRKNNLDAALLGSDPTDSVWLAFALDHDTKPNTLKNFPIQATGAEMLRLACCLATERGCGSCAPIHDAIRGGWPKTFTRPIRSFHSRAAASPAPSATAPNCSTLAIEASVPGLQRLCMQPKSPSVAERTTLSIAVTTRRPRRRRRR